MSGVFRISPALWDKIHHFASFPQTGGTFTYLATRRVMGLRSSGLSRFMFRDLCALMRRTRDYGLVYVQHRPRQPLA